jgi:transcriptional regulator with XRE-family HTH domain
MNEFGELIREARIKRGVTLRTLSETLGLSVPYLSDVEHGRRHPLAKHQWDKVAGLLGLTTDELHSAACLSRGEFTLPLGTATHNRVATWLTLRWGKLSLAKMRELERFLQDELAS